jgi:hypothetical protein
MATIDKPGEDSQVVASGEVIEARSEREEEPSIYVSSVHEHCPPGEATLKVELFGDELKDLLKGHTFFWRLQRNADSVRSFWINLI